jgi:EAL domain-containing protein (putative c-di-GMP-specific phosphodiesterase class I)
MCSQSGDAVIIRSVIDLGHNLGLRVVEEGVEDVDTREHLLANGFAIGRTLSLVDSCVGWAVRL